MERIEDLTSEPVIGRRYLVPCVRTRDTSWWQGLWLPVLGPRHDDARIIGADQPHWHFDFRFLPGRVLDRMRRCDPYRHGGNLVLWDYNAARERPEHRVRVCRRPMPEFAATYQVGQGAQAVEKDVPYLSRLEDAYQGARLKGQCRRCPHQGFLLASQPERGGRIVCPGHGLAFDATTGELVRRTDPETGKAITPRKDGASC